MSEPRRTTHLRIQRDADAVERVTIDRPEVRNAFNETVVAELADWARAVSADPGVRVGVLEGAGTVFSAGADLAWMARMVTYGRDENLRDATALAELFHLLDALPVPLVGRVQGAALGGGAGLAAVCDVVIAADDAVFGFTEVKLGLIPAVISPFVLARIGQSAARELFLTGGRFDAARAREIGLVHRVVPAAALDDAVAACVAELLTSGREAAAAAKRLIAGVAGRQPADVRRLTAEAIADRRASAEGQEGMRAFLERRPPSWSGRR
jgi:methylglutaconyl-CoA hydratase